MSFAEAQYTVDSLLNKLKIGETSGIPSRPIIMSITASNGVNYDRVTTAIEGLDANKDSFNKNYSEISMDEIKYFRFAIPMNKYAIKDTVISGKKVANVRKVIGELMSRTKCIDKETRPGDGAFVFDMDLDEFSKTAITFLTVPAVNKDGVNLYDFYRGQYNPKGGPSSNGGSSNDTPVLKLYSVSDHGVFCYDQNHYIDYLAGFNWGFEEIAEPDPISVD